MPTNDFARHVEYENLVFSFKMTNAGTVKDLAKVMGLQYTGTKKILCFLGDGVHDAEAVIFNIDMGARPL